MSEPINDGGAAYPHAPYALDGRHWSDGSQGKSLRDWFAGQALAGMLADPNNNGHYTDNAAASYRYADAMILARLTKPE